MTTNRTPKAKTTTLTITSTRFALVAAFAVAACHAPSTRPWIEPFREAVADSLGTEPDRALESAVAVLDSIGFVIADSTAAEGYLITRWFDLATGASSSRPGDPATSIRVRVWTDRISRRKSSIVVEAVQRWSMDQGLPERNRERPLATHHPGFALTASVIDVLKERHPITR